MILQKPKVVIIIQARMGSTRLPGKVLALISNKPMLGHLLERVSRSSLADDIVVATTTNPLDDPIAAYTTSYAASYTQHSHIHVFRGSEEDVLERYAQVAKEFSADIIVRLTADCPLIDPQIIDQMIEIYLHAYPKTDYLSNTVERSFPRGMDVEIFSAKSLLIAEKYAKKASEREHVTLYIYQHPNEFCIEQFKKKQDDSSYRLTVDTEEDLELVMRVFKELLPKTREFHLDDILRLLKEKPEWLQVNAHIKQKQV